MDKVKASKMSSGLKQNDILKKFLGKNGPRKVLGSLLAQELVLHNHEVAQRISECLKLEGVSKGQRIITEMEDGQDALLMVLSGTFQLFVKGHPMAEIARGQAVGEFPVLFPGEKHRATVQALEDSVIGRLSGEDLEHLSLDHPILWKHMAKFIEERLIRSGQARPWVNKQPHIFIGSSSESLSVARKIKQALLKCSFTVSLWTDEQIFRLSRTYIESLEKAAQHHDFAILVFQGDDKVRSREKTYMAPRDNVIFEVGLFMGQLGRERTILVGPESLDVKIPSNLLGLKKLNFSSPNQWRTVASAIQKHVTTLGPLQRFAVI